MKRTLITVLATLAVVAVVLLAVGPKLQPVGAGVAVAAPAPAAMAVPMPNRCPNIHAAWDALKSAKTELNDARHDFCGHRRDALEAINRALGELRAAEECDKCK
jgi:hypothetical protein